MNTINMMRIIALLLCSWFAQAHQLSTAYFNAELQSSGSLGGTVQLRLLDLQRELNLDINNNGELTWGEIETQKHTIQDWVKQHLKIQRDGSLCQQNVDDGFQIDHHFNEAYLLIPVQAQCSASGMFGLSYNGVFKNDHSHKMLVNLAVDGQHQSRVIDADQTSIQIAFSAQGKLQMVMDFLWQGMIHIWIGLDHILFLLCLLLACLLQQRIKEDKLDYKSLAFSILGVVTAFTVAHSLTLTATALNWIQLPSRWVEISIAASVLVAAVNNIIPFLPRLVWITFAFGLLHGMGFAGALGELGLPPNHQVWTVLAFNLGVELGQVVIIALVLPLMLLLKKTVVHSHHYFRVCSAAIAVMAVVWMVERI